jgi:hypothetical protein
MLESVRRLFLIDPLEDRIKEVLTLEKSIKENKDKAIESARNFLPIIESLEKNVRVMSIYCDLKKSDTVKRAEGLIMLERFNDKLDIAKSEYYREIGDLRRVNDVYESKLKYLRRDKDLIKGLYSYNKEIVLEEGFSRVMDGFKKGFISKEVLLKAARNYNLSLQKEDVMVKSSI